MNRGGSASSPPSSIGGGQRKNTLSGSTSSSSFPLPVSFDFFPGGTRARVTTAGSKRQEVEECSLWKVQPALIEQAAVADTRLNHYIRLCHAQEQQQQQQQQQQPGGEQTTTSSSETTAPLQYLCPSLSVLAEAAFGRLSGCGSPWAKEWADAMVQAYADTVHWDDASVVGVTSEEDIWQRSFTTTSSQHQKKQTTAQWLKQSLSANSNMNNSENALLRRPCGYVFQRGDIAWNCRTCQTDPTCVICDACFRTSDHEGHEVYFHRTTPGGCCDCGDAEAWKVDGCCPKHKPNIVVDNTNINCMECTTDSNSDSPQGQQQGGAVNTSAILLLNDDPYEAVRMAQEGYKQGEAQLMAANWSPRFATALATVIAAAVQAVLIANDGASVGADPTQWRIRWADEAARFCNQTVHRDEYYNKNNGSFATPTTYLGSNHGSNNNSNQSNNGFDATTQDEETLPEGYRLQLRLHNDDVHTFEEVIDALHDPRQLRRHTPSNASNPDNAASDLAAAYQTLVPLRDSATEMTHHVDADGQVTVKTFATISAAMHGYRRLKSRGLHCSVVSTTQVQLELRARALVVWLTEISAAHPAAAALVVHALVQVDPTHSFANIPVWPQPRCIPIWAGMDEENEQASCRKRFQAFPPTLISSFVTRDEAELMHNIALSIHPNAFCQGTGAAQDFYAKVPYRLPSERYAKSPHALWGTLPALYNDPVPPACKHPLLHRLNTGTVDVSIENRLTEAVFVVDTDLRKQQEADRITTSVFPHKLPGMHLMSGVGTVRSSKDISATTASPFAPYPQPPSPMQWRHLIATSSFRAPVSPILLLLLLDPYPTKQMRAATHALFLSLLTDARFRSRFAGAIGIAYRPLSTLFCAGVGTEADTPLHFTVQIFTAGSLVRALGSAAAVEQLLVSDDPKKQQQQLQQQQQQLSPRGSMATNVTAYNGNSIGVFASPIAHTIVRCIHTNLLGATKEVNMILNNTFSGNDDDSQDDSHLVRNDSLLPALTYVAGEHPLLTPLPAAPDDGFLDSRSTRHKRLPHLLRDLEYVMETPGTALRLLLPHIFAAYQGPSLSSRGEDVLSFPSVYSRMLRLSQGMDSQKRKISGGHVEYEQNRWLEAFGLSLNFGGTRDALAESPMSASSSNTSILVEGNSANNTNSLQGVREAAGNLVASLLREIKFWLYREGMLETGLLAATPHGSTELAQAEALQRSTLHVSGSSHFDNTNNAVSVNGAGEMEAAMVSSSVSTVALACATGVKMTETQLSLIENAIKADAAEKYLRGPSAARNPGPVMGDWLRVPHSPLAGDSLSFHLPLHRALAKIVRSICSVVVPDAIRTAFPGGWWKIPVLDSDVTTDPMNQKHHPLVPLIRSTLRSSNCIVVWMAGPECASQEAQRRRSRSRTVSANIAVAKILHSLVDHPIRCIVAAQQIERHLWARNGSSVAGMAMNYSSTPLCRSFRDLDILLVQLSASGMSCGLGARRVFALLLSRFSMDGYLCDPERRTQASGGTPSSYGSGVSVWVNPPRLQDPDHAVVLSESLFSTLCVIVSELPPPPPCSSDDDASLRQTVRRELLHALAAEPRAHSEAMTAASAGVSRREETDGGAGGSGSVAFREVFTEVLRDIATQKGQRSARATSGPPLFELKASCCDEYDPTFFHLRRNEHQHAMDVVARLRKQKHGDDKDGSDWYCFPLVCPPPKAHPRFLPCRLLLHLQAMDASIRRSLLFALTGGSWLPPPEPAQDDEKPMDESLNDSSDMIGVSYSSMSSPQSGEVPVTTFARRLLHSQNSGSSFPTSRRTSSSSSKDPIPFSQEVVAASSVSFLEVLQLLTLQVHTLEDCASLHRTLPDLDDESRNLSAGLSINSYLGRLVGVPESLSDVWALKPYPEGPLQSKGSGERRGSILGLLIALYEHRADHASLLDADGGESTNDGHGGARSLATSGLKFLLRFVQALVDGAPSVGAATKSAMSGIPIQSAQGSSTVPADLACPSWTIDDEVRSMIRGMLTGLPDLWPKEREKSSPGEKNSAKSKEARKAAQLRVMEMMKRKQAAFAATIGPTEKPSGGETEVDDSETDLCIICRCDDTDGENNGPLGYLGHVQRSRVAQMRATTEASNIEGPSQKLFQSYRVVGHMGCQLRESKAMDSRPLTCLQKGSVVTALQTKMSTEYDVLSRRVLVRHVTKDPNTSMEVATEGWASVQSSQGYVILSPLSTMCYTNSAWGGTRPIIKQCGHAAHLKCVETHTLSLHQRAAGDQPYDGRFAANIADGEFLCPLCKQLSNILIPRDNCNHSADAMDVDEDSGFQSTAAPTGGLRPVRTLLAGTRFTQIGEDNFRGLRRRALKDFGSHLYNAMSVPWDRITGSRKKLQQHWHPSIQKWDFEEDDDGDPRMKNVLRLLRQQLIAWAAVGHSAASSEAGARGIEAVLPFGTFSQTNEPWPEYAEDSRDTHPMALELKRTLTGACGLLEVLSLEMKSPLPNRVPSVQDEAAIIGVFLSDILEGRSWLSSPQFRQSTVSRNKLALWSELTAFTASMPSHVARDGVLPHKCEARATAASMWALKGLGFDTALDDPPTPLAINRLLAVGLPPIPQDWGTMDPIIACSSSQGDAHQLPFRPGVASSYLYKPLLVWDFNTLAGAVLSSVLSNNMKDLPTSEELLHLAQILLIGRTVQAIVTPFGFEQPDEADLEEEDDDECCWSETEICSESLALAKLLSHCQATIKSKSLDISDGFRGSGNEASSPGLLAGVGQAILPFARSLVLMLRACTAAIRERQSKGKMAATKSSTADKLLDSVLFRRDLFTCEDGFRILKALQGPLPSALVDVNGEWMKRIDRWMLAALGFELHHGSVGKTVVQTTNLAAPISSLETAHQKPSSQSSGVSTVARDWNKKVMTTTAPERGEMEVEDVGIGQNIRRFTDTSNNVLMDDVEDSDEEIMADTDEIEDAEEMVEFAGQVMGGVLFQALSPASAGTNDGNESDNSSSGTEGVEGRASDRQFAHVSRSPILPYQPSFLALEEIGPGRQGIMHESAKASAVMADLSHMALKHRKQIPTFSLIRLPKSFVELYNVVNKVKGRDDSANMDENDDAGTSETAICLLTGTVMRSGSSRRGFASRSSRPPGACTVHARKHGSGIGIFFLVQKCTVLLIHNNKSAYSPSIYVDEHGEEDPGLRRGRPLFLNDARYRALEGLWRQQGIPREVAQIRSTSDRVIRDNWY